MTNTKPKTTSPTIKTFICADCRNSFTVRHATNKLQSSVPKYCRYCV